MHQHDPLRYVFPVINHAQMPVQAPLLLVCILLFFYKRVHARQSQTSFTMYPKKLSAFQSWPLCKSLLARIPICCSQIVDSFESCLVHVVTYPSYIDVLTPLLSTYELQRWWRREHLFRLEFPGNFAVFGEHSLAMLGHIVNIQGVAKMSSCCG
jgi:hypothetical protein